MGGFLAYHIGNYYSIPTILLNPALIMKLVVNPTNKVFPVKNRHYLAIGIEDEVISPSTTKKLLQEDKVLYFIKEFKRGHETPQKDFITICKSTNLF